MRLNETLKSEFRDEKSSQKNGIGISKRVYNRVRYFKQKK